MGMGARNNYDHIGMLPPPITREIHFTNQMDVNAGIYHHNMGPMIAI
jgi:hypothetical protein